MFAWLKKDLVKILNTEFVKKKLERVFRKKTALKKPLGDPVFVILIHITQNIPFNQEC